MLIAILLGIIFSVSMVSATLSVKNIISSSGIGYRAANDTIGVNVSSTSNVSMNGVLCNKQGATTYICTATDIVSVAKVIYQLTNTEGDSGTASINVDNNIGSISYVLTNNQNSTSLDYTVQDLGFNNNNVCSGISSLSVYDGSSVLNTVEVNGTPGTCMYTGSINLSISNSGTKSISIEAIDNVGNKKKSIPQNITLDLDAPEIINGLTVKYAGKDEELSVIGGSASLLVDIYFSVREDNLASIILDLSGANTNPVVQYAYKNINLSLSNCEINDTDSGGRVYQCYIKSVLLKLSGDTLNVNVTAQDTFNNIGSATLSKSFTVDNVEPKASITTNKCDSAGRCYIQNGLNKIILTMNKDNFKNKYVFFNIPGSIPGSTFGVNKVQNCTDTVCTALVSLTCESGEMIEASIAGFSGVESQDDAGNVVAPYSTYLYCDNNAPVIKDINVSGDATSIIKEFISGSTLTVTAKVTEVESIELNASLWTDKLKNSTDPGICTKISNYDFNCTWIVSNINAGYYDANMNVTIADSIGNTAVKLFHVKVFGEKSDNETPDNVGISLNKVYPEEINRIVVDMATSNKIPYYVYAQYDLSVAKPGKAGAKISVLHQQVDISKCVYTGTLGSVSASTVFSEITLSNPYGAITDVGRVDLRFNDNTDPNLLDDEFTVSCNISVRVKEGNEVYKNSQELQLDIPFKLVNTKLCKLGEDCTPGVVLGDKIEKEEKNILVRAQLLGMIDNLMPKLQKVCDLRSTISQGTNGALLISMVTNGLSLSSGNVKVGNIPFALVLKLTNLDACLAGPSAGYGNGNTGSYTGGTIAVGGKQDAPTVFTSISQTGLLNNIEQRQNIAKACKGIVGKACDFLTCTKTADMGAAPTNLITEGYQSKIDISAANSVPDLFPDTGSVNADGSSKTFFSESERLLSRNVKVPDVSNSIIMAAKTGCWPAVIYNADKWRQTECAYLYCMKVASYTGTDISTCDKAKFAQQCTMIVGEFAQSIPIAREVTSYMDNAKDYVSNFMPLAAASLLKKVMCPNDIPKSTTTVFDTGTLPKTVVDQSYRIYLCQLPLQIARFADSQSRSKQKVTFRYPEDQDMCALAKCVGEPNCAYEPDFWNTINQIDLPAPKADASKKAINTGVSQSIVDSNKALTDLEALRSDENTISILNTKIAAAGSNTPQYFKDALAATTADRNSLESNLIKQKVLPASYGATGLGTDEINLIDSNLGNYVSKNNPDYNKIVALDTKMTDLDTKGLNTEDDYAKYDALLQSRNQLLVDTGAITSKNRLIDVSSTYNKIQDCLNNHKSSDTSFNCAAQGISVSAIDQQAIDQQTTNYLGMSANEIKALPIDQQAAAITAQQIYITQLKSYDSALSKNYGSLDDNAMINVQGIDGPMTYGTAKSSREALLIKQKLCGGDTGINCDTYSNDNLFGVGTASAGVKANYMSLVANKTISIQSSATQLAQIQRAYKTSESIGTGIYMALQYLNSQHMMKWFFTDTLIEKITGGKNLGGFLDFSKYTQSWCNPDSPINLDGQSDSGSVISCGSGICQPVLTYAAERTELEYPNKTKYNMYTTTYFISGGDLRARNITYNVYFRGDTPELKGYRDDVQLNPFEIVEKKTAFISPKSYTEMCIEFNHPFPPDNPLENANTYCRPIQNSAEGGAFNTGSPWTPEEENTTENDTSVYTNEYDNNGNRIKVSGTSKDTRPLGVFE